MSVTTAHDFTATSIDGAEQPLSEYAGKVLLVVNTASRCGMTPQYAGLEKLHEAYGERGLVVLGFPCDQFGNQEPGDEADIQEFCSLNYGVEFPMFAKVEVNGEGAHPLFGWLRTQAAAESGDAIEWNFTKFLVDPAGRVVNRYGPQTEPEAIVPDLEPLLPR